jgi:predicted RNA-binding protein with PIN domain
MIDVSDDVARVLTRGVSAWLKATPAQELPARLRPIRSFAPKALAGHRKTVLGALDDTDLRPRLLEWLDERQHPLSKTDEALLRLAVERPDAWEQRLQDSPKKKNTRPKKDDHKQAAEALEREKEKARKARDEAKKAREEAAGVVAAETERRKAVETELNSLKVELRTTRARAAAAERDAKKATAAMERNQRKTKTELAREGQIADKLRRELRDVRKDLRATEARVAKLEAAGAAKKAPGGASPARKSSGPRKPLPFVKGLLDDDPRTLEGWLAAADVLLLVDGYNVTKAEGGFGDLELEKQRDRLIEGVNGLLRKRKGCKGTIVFDGSDVSPGSGRRSRGPAKVEYSRPDEIADDHLIALLEGLPPHPVVVVTNDKELQGRARALGATIAGSGQLLALLR